MNVSSLEKSAKEEVYLFFNKHTGIYDVFDL